jgi:hypothetical protein
MESLPEAIVIGLSRLFDKIEESWGFIAAWVVTCSSFVALVIAVVWAASSLA